ncbi:unnamed protein product [Heligmosomoides polygyrus]|uniref:Uncharacterized protein n=1 Tax=Heligmosomoides polygyrus TaxID=6339 RepID=A0A183G201_HELPZ|nr:unnamed protein product [Heligmosomoides polygyrus]
MRNGSSRSYRHPCIGVVVRSRRRQRESCHMRLGFIKTEVGEEVDDAGVCCRRGAEREVGFREVEGSLDDFDVDGCGSEIWASAREVLGSVVRGKERKWRTGNVFESEYRAACDGGIAGYEALSVTSLIIAPKMRTQWVITAWVTVMAVPKNE